MPRFDGATGLVRYREWLVQDPRATTVLAHGVGEHSGLYDRFAAELNGWGISVRALDQIGHGQAGASRGVITSMNDLVSDLRRLTDMAALANAGRPVFAIGHSLGGIITAVTAGRQPGAYAGLILSGTTLSAPPGFGSEAQAEGGDDDLALEVKDLAADPAYLSWLASDPLVFTGGAEITDSLQRILPAAWEEIGASLPELDLPVLLIHGEADQISPPAGARDWSARLGRSALVTFPGSRHDVLNDVDHEAVAATIAGFILGSRSMTAVARFPAARRHREP